MSVLEKKLKSREEIEKMCEKKNNLYYYEENGKLYEFSKPVLNYIFTATCFGDYVMNFAMGVRIYIPKAFLQENIMDEIRSMLNKITNPTPELVMKSYQDLLDKNNIEI